MDRAVFLNNIAILHLQAGDFHGAQEKLKEALGIAKHCAYLLQGDMASGSGEKEPKPPRPLPLPLRQAAVHSTGSIPGLWDSSFYLCDQAIFIQPPFHAMDEASLCTDKHVHTPDHIQHLWNEPSLIGTCSATIIFNTALAFHAYAMREPSHNRQLPWLANAQKLYEMSRAIMLEHAPSGVFAATNLSVRVAATNNLVQIHSSRRDHTLASQSLQELCAILNATSQRSPSNYYTDGSILSGVLRNFLATKASAAAAA
jgi:hypothetical protein